MNENGPVIAEIWHFEVLKNKLGVTGTAVLVSRVRVCMEYSTLVAEEFKMIG
jgi:hypothetical protein